MKKSKEIQKIVFYNLLRYLKKKKFNNNKEVEERDDLLKRMGVKEKKVVNISLIIDNDIETVINPYLIAKYHSEMGLDKDSILKEIERVYKLKVNDYWSGWCEFWFNSFITIPHNTLLDSKKYFEALEKVDIGIN